MSDANPLDKLLLSLGSPGKFQVFLFILLCSNAYPITFNFLYITFFGNNVPPYHCQIPENGTKEEYIPAVEKTGTKFKTCRIYNISINPKSEISCENGPKKWKEGYDWTISREWDLVCSKEKFSALSGTIFFAGVMIGGIIFGSLADKFGRKPVVLFTLYGQALLGIGIAFSPGYITFVVLKFLQGALLQGLQSSNTSLVMELFPLQYRTLAGMILTMCATSGHIGYSGLLFLIPYWNWMQLAISCLTSVTLLYSWLYPESIRWLLSQNHQTRALKSVERFAKVNKVALPQDIKKQLEDISKDIMSKAQNVAKYDIRDLFHTPRMRKYTFVLIFSWFSSAVTYYGIQFYVPKMTHRHLNLLVSGTMETAARFVGYFIIDHIGRRKPLVFFFTLSGLLCIAAGLAGDFLKIELVSNILAILGKLCIAQCFAFNLVYTSEIFPTVVRTIGGGVAACAARIGAMIAPQLLSLQDLKKDYSDISLWLPFSIFGIVSLISAVLIFLLPETRGKPLPNTIEDIEEYHNVVTPVSFQTTFNEEDKGVHNPAHQDDPDSKNSPVVPINENANDESIRL